MLLVDMDPQASLTQGIFGPRGDRGPCRSGRHRRRPVRRRPRPRPGRHHHPDPLRADRARPGVEQPGRLQHPPAPRGRRAAARPPAVPEGGRDGRFDVALIDCPPNLNLCSWSALLAADFVVVPVQAEDYGAQGIVYIQRAFDLALAKHNPPAPPGRLPGDHVQQVAGDPHRLRAPAPHALRRPGLPPRRSRWPRTSRRRSPPASRSSAYKPRSAAAKAIKAVADELLERAESAAARPAEFLYLGHRVGPQDLAMDAVA